jgi:tRNA (mo5U34)-methyltransferase
MRNRTMTRDEIAAKVSQLGEWFHNMDLGGVSTAPHHFLGDYPRIKWERFAHAVPRDLGGRTVLDVGCNAGFYAIEMKRRGAARVLGIDTDEGYLAQARFAAEIQGVDIELRKMSVYEVGRLHETFDVVIFMGVLYHLRHPLLALDLLRRHAVRGSLLFQSMQRGSAAVERLARDYPFAEKEIFGAPWYPTMHFVEHCYAGDPTNWWIPNRACVEAMLRSAGFDIAAHPEDEVYVCTPREEGTAADPDPLLEAAAGAADSGGARP